MTVALKTDGIHKMAKKTGSLVAVWYDVREKDDATKHAQNGSKM